MYTVYPHPTPTNQERKKKKKKKKVEEEEEEEEIEEQTGIVEGKKKKKKKKKKVEAADVVVEDVRPVKQEDTDVLGEKWDEELTPNPQRALSEGEGEDHQEEHEVKEEALAPDSPPLLRMPGTHRVGVDRVATPVWAAGFYPAGDTNFPWHPDLLSPSPDPPFVRPATLAFHPDFPQVFTVGHCFRRTVAMTYRRGNSRSGKQWPEERWQWVQEADPNGLGAWAWVPKPHGEGDPGRAPPNPIVVNHMGCARPLRFTLQRQGRAGGLDHRQAHVPDFQFLCCLWQRAGVGTLNLGHGPATFTVNWQEAIARGWWNPAHERAGNYTGKLPVPCLQVVRPIPNPPNSPQPPIPPKSPLPPNPPNSTPGGTLYGGPAPVGPPSEADAMRAWREALVLMQQQQTQPVQVSPPPPLKPTPALSYSRVSVSDDLST